MPVFVISRTHLQFGVAFEAIEDRWAYSEICEYSVEQSGMFSSKNDDHVLQLLHFCNFSLSAAQYHHSGAHILNPQTLVDGEGQNEMSVFHAIGSRVLMGEHQGKQKVLKLYTGEKAAKEAVENQIQLSEVLQGRGISPNPVLIKGCGASASQGMFAVLDNQIEETPDITYTHFLDLAEQVDLLHKHGLVHGDLGAPSIRFLPDGKVALIDFEWSGRLGVARFPKSVNWAAFGNHAQEFANSKHKQLATIHRNFDWCCLSDLLYKIQCSDVAAAALCCRLDRVSSALSDLQHCSQVRKLLQRKLRPRPEAQAKLDLQCLGERLGTFLLQADHGIRGPQEAEVGVRGQLGKFIERRVPAFVALTWMRSLNCQ
jgi:hypothetical protein